MDIVRRERTKGALMDRQCVREESHDLCHRPWTAASFVQSRGSAVALPSFLAACRLGSVLN